MDRALTPLVFGPPPWQFPESILPAARDIMPTDHPSVTKGKSDPAAVDAAIDVDSWRRNIRQTTFAGYHFHMAVALWEEGSHAAALDALQRALNEKPAFPGASFRMAEFLRQVGRHDEADRVEQAARAATPAYPAAAHADFGQFALERGDAREAIRELSKACAAHADSAWEAALAEAVEIANTAVAETEFAMTVPVLRRVLAFDPARTTTMRWLGYQSLALCSLEEAERWLSRSVLLDPNDLFFRAVLAMTRTARGDTDGALATLQERSPAEAKTSLLPSVRGLVCLARGDVDSAVAHYTEAIRIEPGNASLQSGLGLALQEIGRIDEALRYHNAAGDSGLICLHRAIAWHRAGNEEKARNELRRLLAQNPVLAWSWARTYLWVSPYLIATMRSIAAEPQEASRS